MLAKQTLHLTGADMKGHVWNTINTKLITCSPISETKNFHDKKFFWTHLQSVLTYLYTSSYHRVKYHRVKPGIMDMSCPSISPPEPLVRRCILFSLNLKYQSSDPDFKWTCVILITYKTAIKSISKIFIVFMTFSLNHFANLSTNKTQITNFWVHSFESTVQGIPDSIRDSRSTD